MLNRGKTGQVATILFIHEDELFHDIADTKSGLADMAWTKRLVCRGIYL